LNLRRFWPLGVRIATGKVAHLPSLDFQVLRAYRLGVGSKDNPFTIYSNLMQVRVTPNELVLEFGTFFPEQIPPPQVGPKEFAPEVRVVMTPGALEQLTDALLKATAAKKAASQQPSTVAKAQ
jgi:hypothetical protein